MEKERNREIKQMKKEKSEIRKETRIEANNKEEEEENKQTPSS